MEREPTPRVPAGLRIREYETPIPSRTFRGLDLISSPSRVIVEVY